MLEHRMTAVVVLVIYVLLLPGLLYVAYKNPVTLDSCQTEPKYLQFSETAMLLS